MLNLQTTHGELDLTIRLPAFEEGYDQLLPSSTERTVGAVRVRVAALADVIASKEAAGRDKDNRALPELYELANRRVAAASFPDPPEQATRPSAPATAQQRIAAARAHAATRRREQGQAGPIGTEYNG